MLYLQIDVTKNITKNERDVVKMVIDYEIIGKRIRAEIVKQKITQEDMAEKIETSISIYSRIETGRANILNVSAGYFLTGIEEEADDYLYKDFKMILEQCTAKQQKIIYRMAEVVLEEIKI